MRKIFPALKRSWTRCMFTLASEGEAVEIIVDGRHVATIRRGRRANRIAFEGDRAVTFLRQESCTIMESAL